jgi:hypothetical protein
MNSFQLVGLPAQQFVALFAMSDIQLSAHNACRVIAATNPGYPCRISLIDARIGEQLLLLPYQHLAADSPYKASGPIFVREAATQAALLPGQIPDYVRSRVMSVRAYDRNHRMIHADVCAGESTAAAIDKFFSDSNVAYIHLHNAKQGCFSCAVNRA